MYVANDIVKAHARRERNATRHHTVSQSLNNKNRNTSSLKLYHLSEFGVVRRSMGNQAGKGEAAGDVETGANQPGEVTTPRGEQCTAEAQRIAQLLEVEEAAVVWNKDEKSTNTQTSQYMLKIDDLGTYFIKSCNTGDDNSLPVLVPHGETTDDQPMSGLKRERTFLRAWGAAIDSGEIKLPDDTTLMLPRLVEGQVVGSEGATEEVSPTFLVMEDLNTSGFTPLGTEKELSDEDAKTIAGAIADLHGGIWQMEEQLLESLRLHVRPGLVENVDDVRRFIERFGEDPETKDRIDGVLAQIESYVVNTQKSKVENDVEESEPVPKASEGDSTNADVEEPDIAEKVPEELYRIQGPLCHGDPCEEHIFIRRDGDSGKIVNVAVVGFSNLCVSVPISDVFGFMFKSVGDGKEAVTEAYSSRLKSTVPQGASVLSSLENAKEADWTSCLLVHYAKVWLGGASPASVELLKSRITTIVGGKGNEN